MLKVPNKEKKAFVGLIPTCLPEHFVAFWFDALFANSPTFFDSDVKFLMNRECSMEEFSKKRHKVSGQSISRKLYVASLSNRKKKLFDRILFR